MVKGNPAGAVLGREPVVQLVLDGRHQRFDGVLHQPRTGLHVLRARKPAVIAGTGDANHPRVDAERRADVLTRHPTQVGELEVGQREAQGLDVLHAPEHRRLAAIPSVHHALNVPRLHRVGVLLRGLVVHHDGERRGAVIGHDLPHVLRGFVIGQQRLKRRCPTREAEHVGGERAAHLEVAHVHHVLGGDRHHAPTPIAVLVNPRIPFSVHEHGLNGLGIDAPQALNLARARPLQLQQRIAIAEHIDREGRPHLP